jgi:hypothetical protein
VPDSPGQLERLFVQVQSLSFFELRTLDSLRVKRSKPFEVNEFPAERAAPQRTAAKGVLMLVATTLDLVVVEIDVNNAKMKNVLDSRHRSLVW